MIQTNETLAPGVTIGMTPVLTVSRAENSEWTPPATIGGTWARVRADGVYEFSRSDPRGQVFYGCTCGRPWGAIIPPPPCPTHGAAEWFTITC